MKQKYVVWFHDVDKEDGAIVGGKGANLGEMTQAGFPVPQGFIVTAQAYYAFLDANNLRETIKEYLGNLDVNDSHALEHASVKIRKAIVHAPFPKDISKLIIDSYSKMEHSILRHPMVAVRSSATAEDLPGASFAGQQETFLNVTGEAALLEKVRECWASLFTQRAIFYRQTNKFDHFKVGIAVPVQKMVNADRSGIMFTIDPVTNDKNTIMIEAIFGLGEMIVQGMVTPDHYEVDKKSDKITKRVVNTQEKLMRKKGSGNEVIPLSKKEGSKVKLTDTMIHELAELARKLEKHYYFPQDSEWAIENGHVFLVQTRPVTTAGKDMKAGSITLSKMEELLKGDPASPGIASGIVKILGSAKEIHKIQTGDVLVAEQTNPDYVPAMKKAAAIVTERGGRTSHAAIVSRELGIPAVVGTAGVMSKLKDKMVVTVNGATGQIFKGALSSGDRQKIEDAKAALVKRAPIITATKVMVNLAEPDRAKELSKRQVDGVGLLRAEFMIADIGTHPRKLIEEKKQHVFIDTLSEHISEFCEAFSPRPVIYRATDFKTNEYRNLKGGAAYEPEEPNPMLGFRGAARYIADAKVFEMEIEAIKKVRNKMGFKNLHVMIPFVRNPKELLEVKKILASNGLSRSQSFKLYMMVEIPTNIIRIDDFLDVGVDGISIGSNDLTMLMLGTDRDNSEVAHDFSELDPSVLWALEHVIKSASKRGVASSICGQAPSDYPEIVEKLVSWGITSVSVNPDAIDRVRETVALAEKRLVTKKK